MNSFSGKIIILLLLLSSYAFAQKALPASSCGWYKVIKSSQPEIWSVGQNVRVIQGDSAGQFQLMGFTNQGATVSGVTQKNQVIVMKQNVEIMPYGGDGKSGWRIEAEANGKLAGDELRFDFYFKQDTFPSYIGEVVAKRMSEQDTVIRGKYYAWLKYDLNRTPYEIGESNVGGIKNGKWIFRDQQGRITSEGQYVNDTLNGSCVEYGHLNPPVITRMEGLCVKGKKIGIWKYSESGRFRIWKKKGYGYYDSDGHQYQHRRSYRSGKPMVDMFFDKAGNIIWYRIYKRNGKVKYEGNETREVMIAS